MVSVIDSPATFVQVFLRMSACESTPLAITLQLDSLVYTRVCSAYRLSCSKKTSPRWQLLLAPRICGKWKLHHLNKYLQTRRARQIYHPPRGTVIGSCGRRAHPWAVSRDDHGQKVAGPQLNHWAPGWNLNILTLVRGTFNCIVPAAEFIAETHFWRT